MVAVLAVVVVHAGDAAGLDHFESHLATFREHLEVEVTRLTFAAQQLTEQQDWWDSEPQVSEIVRGKCETE